MTKKLNVSEFIQESRFNHFHLRLLLIGFLLVMFDGYDVAVYGSIVPALMHDWKITPVQAGAIGSYSLFGMLFGAIAFGMLADRWGRKRVVFLTVVIFSTFTALCGFATEPATFSVFRFVAGLGLGGILPNAIALLTDYSPMKQRTTIATIVLCGYSLGGILAPLFSILLIPQFGWQSVLWLAAAPLLLLPLVYRHTPESTFVLIRQGRRQELFDLLARIDPSKAPDRNSEPYEVDTSQAKLPLTDLFRNHRGLSTVMFSLAILFHLILGYGLINWLPKLMLETGFDMKSSLSFLIVLQCGAIVGTLVLGRLADKYGSRRVLIPLYLSGAVAMLLLGINKDPFWMYVLVAIAGAPVVGAQNLVQVYMSQYYPVYVRSTALGTASSVGRIGGMIGPLLGGLLLSFSLPIQSVFMAFAIPGVCSALAIAMVRNRPSEDRQPPLGASLDQAH
jgi:AAHS family benzoate transporter-like MFS transporter